MRIRIFPAAFLLLAVPAWTQSNLVPPTLEEQRQAQRDAKAINGAILSGATALPEAIVKGGAMLQHGIGGDASVLMSAGAKTVGKIVDGHVVGAQLLNAAATEGSDGFWREGAQIVLDKGGQNVGEFSASFFVNRAVAAGAGAVMAEDAAGLAFNAGWIAGKYLREKTGIGDTIDDFEFAHTPDYVKEFISGTPQVDIDNADWQRDQEAKARAWIRANAFAAVQQQNVEQQREIEAAQANAAVVSSSPEPVDDGTIAGINALLGTIQAAAAARPAASAESTRGGACTPAKTIDPKTGCHPGHDEKAHPGGCRCG